MKKIMPILAMLIIVPFVLCSCFTKQVESMSLSYEELELHVGDTKHISVTIKPDGRMPAQSIGQHQTAKL